MAQGSRLFAENESGAPIRARECEARRKVILPPALHDRDASADMVNEQCRAADPANRDRIGGVSCCARRPQATLPSRHFRNDASQDLLAQRQQSPSGVHLLRPKISKGWTDTMLKTTIAAAFVAAAFAGPAHAIPASSPAASLVEVRPELIQVRNHNKRNWNRRHYRNRGAHWNRRHYRGRNYYRGHRYRGWNRYSARPWNWRARGCASVGPLWFCP